MDLILLNFVHGYKHKAAHIHFMFFLPSNANSIQILRAGEHQIGCLLLSNIYSIISYLISEVTFILFRLGLY
jgi:hypothetical protein